MEENYEYEKINDDGTTDDVVINVSNIDYNKIKCPVENNKLFNVSVGLI